jgi:hypothetical protein
LALRCTTELTAFTQAASTESRYTNAAIPSLYPGRPRLFAGTLSAIITHHGDRAEQSFDKHTVAQR